MTLTFWWLAAISLLCSIAKCDESARVPTESEQPQELEESPTKEYVVTLTEANFAKFVDAQERTLVEFYAPWCGHCKALAPEYEEAARILAEETESKTRLAKVDATEAQALAQQFQVEGYPTLVLVEGQTPKPYDGGRTSQEIVDWILKQDIPAYTLLTYEEFELRSATDTQQAIDVEVEPTREFEVFAFIKKGSKRDRLFNQFTNEVRGRDPQITFYKIYLKDGDEYKVILRRNNRKIFSDETLDGEYEVSYDGKLLPSKKARKSLFYFKKYDIMTWVQEHKLPFFINLDEMGDIHPYNVIFGHAKVPRSGAIIIRIPRNDTDAVLKLKNNLIDFVQELRANEGFLVILTSGVYDRIGFTPDVNILLVKKAVEKLPKLPPGFKAMQGDPNRMSPGSYFLEQHEQMTGKQPKNTLKTYRYQYKESIDDIDGEMLRKWLTDTAKVTPWVRSQKNTEKSDDISYDIMTADNFREKALDKASDTLLLYCTPHGRYCGQIMEEYNKLAEHMQTFYKGKSINIAYFDCGENDIEDLRVASFPTMILYVGGTDKMEDGLLLSQAQSTLFDIVDFIDEHAASLNKDEL